MFLEKNRFLNRLSLLSGLVFFITSSCLLTFAASQTIAPKLKVEIKGDWFYVDGERFFVKGIGYSPYRPNQKPGDKISLELVENDLKLIKDGGFNTIRAWNVLEPEVLALAKKYDLMVIQGTDANLDQAIVDPVYLEKAVNLAEEEIKQVSPFDNILMFLFANELPGEKVFSVGIINASKVLKEFKEKINQDGYNNAISISDSPQLGFMDDTFWDAICFNLYVFMPASIYNSMGFGGYISHLKEKYATNKPLIITEYGVSISKSLLYAKPEYCEYGFGGNTLEQQKQGVLYMLDEIINAGATGACVFEWIDEWWKNFDTPGDWETHDDDAEEWFGLLGLDNKNSDLKGAPRPVYYALKDYNQAILIEPKDMSVHGKFLPIEVYVTEDINSVDVSANGRSWTKLKRHSKHWFGGSLNWWALGKDGEKLIQVRAKGKNGKTYKKQALVWTYSKKELIKDPVSIKIAANKEKYKPWESIKVRVQARDKNNKPLSGINIDFAIFDPQNWIQTRGFKVTDNKGEAIIKYAYPRSGFLTISAGMLYKDNDFNKRFGDIVTIEVQKNGN